jgi:2-polyprenyl-6-methoxyphenol hydroxylase-like FAD-dependent oxidoreductase
MNSKNTALVAGAGIAGLAIAAGLHKLGWEVHLTDRRPDLGAPIPTGLFLPANGMRAFSALGAADALLSRGHVIARMRLRGPGVAEEGIACLEDVWPGVGPSMAIQRGLAQDALRSWCPVRARTGIGVRSLTQRDSRVQVTLTDGSCAGYDLVVGADGAYSTVRGQFWPDAQARYGGESWWRGVVRCPDKLEEWSACFCAAGTFLAMPVGAGLAYWTAGQYTASSFHDPVPGRAARVRSQFSDVTGVHALILDQVTDDARIQFSPADEVWVDMPVCGRAVLVGDAWHAATPSMAQGGSMAAEDALVLAQELAASADIDEALERYASRRRPRTAHVQETTAMRNQLAALPLADRVSFVVPRWAELSAGSFAALVPAP